MHRYGRAMVEVCAFIVIISRVHNDIEAKSIGGLIKATRCHSVVPPVCASPQLGIAHGNAKDKTGKVLQQAH